LFFVQNYTIQIKKPLYFFIFHLQKRIFHYFCSPMRYLMKPSEKIITTESVDSITLNFKFSPFGGHLVGRLFFANIYKLNP